MTDNRKTTVPGASVGADAVQSSSKINTNIITNSDKQINLQAAKKSNNFGLNTVSMTELYDTVYPPRYNHQYRRFAFSQDLMYLLLDYSDSYDWFFDKPPLKSCDQMRYYVPLLRFLQ